MVLPRYIVMTWALAVPFIPGALAATAPVFSLQPTNLTVPGGQSAYFAGPATGDPAPSYQWFFNSALLAARTNGYLLVGPCQTSNQGYYSVVASNVAGTASSDSAFLTVVTNPVGIVTQPPNTTATVGQSVAISIVATGRPPPDFHWQFNGAPLSRFGFSLFFSPVHETNAGRYQAILSNSVNSVTSEVAVLTVDPHPLITLHPTDVSGAEVTLHGTAFGRPPLAYQWYHNSSPIPGATTNFLDIFDAITDNSGSYYFTVSNAVGIATSEVAHVTIQPPAVYAGAVDVAFRAGNDQQRVDAMVLRPDGRIVAARWFPSLGERRVRQFLPDGAVDPSFVSSVGFSNTIRALAIQQDGKVLVGADFEPWQFPSRQKLSRLNGDGTRDNSFVMSPPSLYDVHTIVAQGDDRIVYGGSNYGRGNFVLSAVKTDGTRDLTFTPKTIASPSGGGVGAPEVDSVLALRERFDGKLVMAGLLVNRQIHSDGAADTGFAALYAGDLVELDIDGRVYFGNTLNSLTPERRRLRRTFANGSPDPAFDFDNSLSNQLASISAISIQTDGKVVFAGRVRTNEQYTFSLLGRINPDGTRDPTFAESRFHGEVKSLKTLADCTLLVAGSFTNINGFKRSGLARLHLDSPAAPVITKQPESLALNEGQDAAFVVRATCAPDTKAQWQFNGLPVAGETNLVFRIAHVQQAHTGSYAVAVSNAWGSATSEVATLTVAAAPLNAGALDVSFYPGTGCNNSARAILRTGNGKLVIAGAFTRINGVPRYQVARFKRDGTLDETFDPGAGSASTITCLAETEDGKIYIGGPFTNFNGFATRGVARLNGDGSVDSTFRANIGPTGSVDVRGLVVQSSGKLIVGGVFSGAGTNLARRHLVRLHQSGGVDESFQQLWDAANNTVRLNCLKSLGDEIVIGGYFGNQFGTADYVLRLRPDGNVNGPFYSSPGFEVVALAPQSDGRIVVAGDTPSFRKIQRLIPNGPVDPMFNVNFTNWFVRVSWIDVDPCGRIYMGGQFLPQDGSGWKHLLRFNANGNVDAEFVPPAIDGRVLSGTLLDGRIAVAGEFATINGASRPRVALLHGGPYSAPSIMVQPISQTLDEGSPLVLSSGGPCTIPPPVILWTLNGTNVIGTNADLQIRSINRRQAGLYSVTISNAFGVITSTPIQVNVNPSPTIPGSMDVRVYSPLPTNGLVNAMVIQPDGKVVLGGTFSNVFGAPSLAFVRLNTDGELDTAFEFSGRFEGRSVAVRHDHRLLISEWTGWPNYRVRVRGLTASGASDSSLPYFEEGDQYNSGRAVLVDTHGKVLVGRSDSVMQLQPTGFWGGSLFAAGFGSAGIVQTLVLQPGGKVLAGAQRGLWRMATNGISESSFVQRTAITGTVFSVAVQLDGKIIAGGSFIRASGTNRGGIARFHRDGTLDPSFMPQTIVESNFTIRAMVCQPDGKIIIGGLFSSYDGVARNGVARLHPDGSLDETFDPQLEHRGGQRVRVEALALARDGALFVGGAFTHVNRVPRQSFAKLYNNPQMFTAAVHAGRFVTSFVSVFDRTYILELAASLESGAWSQIDSVQGDGQINTLEHASGSRSAGFYRVRVE